MRQTWSLLLIFAFACPISASGSWKVLRPANTPESVAFEPRPREHCMDLVQLKEAVREAAWSTTAGGVPRSAVILTSCSLHCMQMLFEPWMWSIQHNPHGDFSQHIIIVCNGVPAHEHCIGLQATYKHRCVLDRMCLPHSAPEASNIPEAMGYGNPLYYLALLQKLSWAHEVIKLGVSIMWSDMDIFYFGHPLKWILDVAPDADLIIQSETWDPLSLFTGDVCKYDQEMAHTSPEACMAQQTSSLRTRCCGMVVNGGLWLINHTPAGKALLAMWEALLFDSYVVQRQLWDAAPPLDQSILTHLLFHALTSAPLYKWDAEQRQYVRHGRVEREPGNERIYRTSMQRMQSFCMGLCGASAAFKGYRMQTRCMGGLRPALCPSRALSNAPDPGSQLVCAMPRKHAERVLSMHQNCIADAGFKRLVMLTWMNWTIDEAQYEQLAPEDKVYPDW